MQRHRHQEFIRFLDVIEKQVPEGKTIHAVVDNSAAHKHPNVRRWLEHHPRWTFHFTPLSASWLNAVEGFFATYDDPQAQARRLSLRRRPASRDQPLPRRAQSAIAALRLDRRSRQNHRRRQTRAPSVELIPQVSALQSISRFFQHMSDRERAIASGLPLHWRLLTLRIAGRAFPDLGMHSFAGEFMPTPGQCAERRNRQTSEPLSTVPSRATSCMSRWTRSAPRWRLKHR